MKIKLKNYARQLWLSLLLLVGVAAIAVPGLNRTNSGGVAKIDGKEYPVSLVQSIVHYRSSKAGYRLTYFGKRDFVTEATGITSNALEDIGEMMLQAKAVLHFRYISAHEGTLRAQIWKD